MDPGNLTNRRLNATRGEPGAGKLARRVRRSGKGKRTRRNPDTAPLADSHWAAGGETSVQNLALACSRHHHEIHTGAWTITMGPDGHPHVTKTHNQHRRQ